MILTATISQPALALVFFVRGAALSSVLPPGCAAKLVRPSPSMCLSATSASTPSGKTTGASRSLPTACHCGEERNSQSTPRSCLPHRVAGGTAGAALLTARRAKERTYPESLPTRSEGRPSYPSLPRAPSLPACSLCLSQARPMSMGSCRPRATSSLTQLRSHHTPAAWHDRLLPVARRMSPGWG